MANFSISSPQPQHSFAAPSVTSTIIDPRDFENAPDVYGKLVQFAPNEHQDLLWMQKMGMVKKIKATAQNPIHKETNRRYSTGTVASFSQLGGGATATNPNNNAISVVFDGPYSPNGKESYFRAGEKIEFGNANRTQGYIISIDKTSDFAHKVNITPVSDPTISYATYAAQIATGQAFFAAEAPGGEKSSVIGDTVIPSFTLYTHQIEKCSETAKFTFTQMSNESWFKYKDKDGKEHKKFWHHILGEAWVKFFAKREIACLIGQGQTNPANAPVDIEGNPYYTTEGLITAMINRGSTQLALGPEVTIDLIEDIARIGQRNHTGNKYLIWAAQDLVFKFNRFGIAIGAGGGVTYDTGNGTEKKFIANFTDYGIGGYELEVKPLSSLSHAGTLGIPGAIYNQLGLIMPKTEAIVETNTYGEGNMQGERTLPFAMLYKECLGEEGGQVGRGDYMYLVKGGLSPYGSSELKDNFEVGMISHFAARTTRTREMMLLDGN